MPFHGMAQAVRFRFRRGRRGIGQFRLDHLYADHLFRIQRREPADEILQLADVAGPPVALQPAPSPPSSRSFGGSPSLAARPMK